MNGSLQLLRPHDLDEGRLRDVAPRSGRVCFRPENRNKQRGPEQQRRACGRERPCPAS
jgi:hypothetical protein